VNVAINYVGIDGACETKSAIERGLDSCMASMQSSGTKPIVVEADVSSEEQVSRMFDEVMSTYGGIDILINNAGIQIASDSEQLSVEDFDRVIGDSIHGGGGGRRTRCGPREPGEDSRRALVEKLPCPGHVVILPQESTGDFAQT
jgi:hypothetical protein